MKIKKIYIIGFLLLLTTMGYAQVEEEEEEIVEIVIESTERDLRYSKEDIPEPDLSLRTKPTHKYKNDTLWFTYDWNVIKDIKLAHYFRTKPVEKDNLFLITDHYLDGTIQMQGTFIDFDGNIEHGELKYFKPNGSLDFTAYYANDKFVAGDRSDSEINVIKESPKYIDFKLPSEIIKKEVKEEDSNFSFRDLFDVDKQLRSELNLDESIYITKEEDNKITTTERKTGQVISTLITDGKKITSGFLKLYNGSRLIGEVKPNANNKLYELILYHKNGNVFLTSVIEKGSSKFYAPNGDIIAGNDGRSGSFLLGLDNKRVLGFSYITPVDENQSFVVGYLENGKMLYADQYYRYNVPYRIYDKESDFTREYKEDGTVISEYINPNKGDIYGFGLGDKLTDGYRSTLYKSKRLKSKTYYQPTTKTTEHYRDDESESIASKEFYKKDEVDGYYFLPYQRIKYNKSGVKIFEEKIEDRDQYSSINYNDKGKSIGEFTCETYGRSLGAYPANGRNQNGYITNTYETDSYEMFESPNYEDINVKVQYEHLYEDGKKKKELLKLNGVVFIDNDWDGKSTFYNPIDGKHVQCVFKEGSPFSGEYVEYSVSSNSIKLESIKKYKEGELYYEANFEHDYSDGTYYDTKTEIIDGQEIVYTYLNDKEYKYNKSLKDGLYVGSGWKLSNLLGDHTYYKLGADFSVVEFKNGELLTVENYKDIYMNKYGDKTPNTTHFLMTNTLYYQNGKLERLDTYWNPEGIFKNFQNKLTLEFKDELPYNGAVIIEKYFDNEYYRVVNGNVIQKLKRDSDEFFEITNDFVKVKKLRDRDEYSYNDYMQIIKYSKKDYTYLYTAIGPDKKEYQADFEGVKMKKGVFYLKPPFEDTHTVIVKNGMVYMVDKYISPDTFNTSLATKEVPLSGTDEDFKTFFGIDDYSSPIWFYNSEDSSLELSFD